ncbi:4-hydroxy-tetrahydrodipicolinate synthase [Luteimicrobium subarcticum]|uniref:4-hydroxy-tetrahydrodipicolinate synthase n=1 Tax=Luteimicrobium subarcticum TaxID=620910 RepID=A0A2M8WTX1_9MICO|nr:4-hydroxy-tetrahydrodipicolinate synthase [Luteimicrobium subarcticum]PJI94391.1 dihydrodipicolinate synthase [Luteimicrobium subarcticum]
MATPSPSSAAQHGAPTAVPGRPFGALLTAMVTPMSPGGAVDLDAAVRLARYLVDHGHDGLVLNGTTGESPTTHAEEKAALVAAVVEAVGDRAAVVAGAGSNDTDHAVRMAEQAAEAGAHGLLVVTPYYSRPTQHGLYEHMLRVAGSTDLPVMVYDVPGRTGLRIAESTYERLAAHDQFVACKDATGDLFAASRLAASTGWAWYCGDDSLYLPFLAVGAAGLVGVASHVLGRELRDLTAAFDAGDTARALAIHRAVTPVIEAINGAGAQAVMAKAAVEALGLVDGRHLRLPQVPATDDEAATVVAALERCGVLDPS